MIFYTSDLHLGHANVIRFDKRPFVDVEEMDQYIITRWNERVSEDDTVYILGDICHRNSRDSSWYLKQLKGHKILILGNHDNPILKNKRACSCFDKVDKMMQVVDEKRQITLCHYPIVEWNACPYIYVECKNYTGEVANPEIDQLSGRFSNRRGRVGILTCRELEENFIKRCADTYNDERGLVIPLEDSDLKSALLDYPEKGVVAVEEIIEKKFKQIVFMK